MDREALVDRFANDLDALISTPETEWQEGIRSIHTRYAQSGVCRAGGNFRKMDEKSLEVFTRQRTVLQRNLHTMRNNARRKEKREESQRQRMMEENTFLMEEINDLRREKVRAAMEQ